MSAENVELVRSCQLGPDADVAVLVKDDEAAGRLGEAIGRLFAPSVQCTMRFPGVAPVTYPRGLPGLRAAWLDWLRQWASYRVEIEDMIDCGDRVLVVNRVRARRRADAPEITLRRANVWTVHDQLIVHVDFNLAYADWLTSGAATA